MAKIKKAFIFCFLSLFLCGCNASHFTVQVEKVKEDYLASTWVGTPDYRQEDPPLGQRIIIYWRFPYDMLHKDLTLCLTVRFWDNTQVEEKCPINHRFGSKTFFFSNKDKTQKNKILTYRIQAIAKDGTVVETWKHQFWTELINVDSEEEN